MTTISGYCGQFSSYLGKGLVATGAAAAIYAGGIPAALTALGAYAGYRYLTQPARPIQAATQQPPETISSSPAQKILATAQQEPTKASPSKPVQDLDDIKEPTRLEKVQAGLKRELYKRLPPALKEEILAAASQGPVSPEELQLLKEPKKWPNIETIHRIAIRACLEGSISEEKLSYLMIYCMAIEMQQNLPGIKFLSTRGSNPEHLQTLVASLCKKLKISTKQFLEIIGKDDFFIVDMNEQLDPYKHNHYTAILSGMQYPYVVGNEKKRMFIFPPHVYERLQAHFHGPHYEKPLFVLGSRSIEKLSDNKQRVVSMTGGKTIPTPHIEANESLAMPFYTHDCYHVGLDSAIGEDRPFWNALGKKFLAASKAANTPDMAEALQTLGEFCLDKEFENYRNMPKNLALLISLIGIFETAGKRQTDDQEVPFKPIADAAFTRVVQQKFLNLFTQFWREEAPQLDLRADLTKPHLLAALNGLKPILNRQELVYPPEVEACLRAL